MFCNYCRAPNPDDAVYCAACGQAVWHPAQKQTDELTGVRSSSQSSINPSVPSSPSSEKPSATRGIGASETEVPCAENLPKTPPPKLGDLSSFDYEKMSDVELTRIQDAYAKVRVSPNAALLKELERRSQQSEAANRGDVGSASIQTEPMSGAVHGAPRTQAIPQGVPANDSSNINSDAKVSANETTQETGLS